jgi:putative phosphoesterase
MRIAVLGDVHGNRFALEAVLQEIEASKPDAVINLGDQVWGGADPAGAWALQRDLESVRVRGNTDEFLVPSEQFAPVKPQIEWLRSQLDPDVPAALEALPITAELAGGEVLACHGAPSSPWQALFMTQKDGETRPATHAEMLEQIAGFPKARVVIVGHTHQENIAARHGITLVNAGPVSRQSDGLLHARWVLLEHRAQAWQVQFHRVQYDHEAAARWALAHAPDGAKEAEQLRTGRFPS